MSYSNSTSYVVRTLVGGKEYLYLRPYPGEDHREFVGWVDDPAWASLFGKQSALAFAKTCRRNCFVTTYASAKRAHLRMKGLPK
jgi:hypothetical protein